MLVDRIPIIKPKSEDQKIYWPPKTKKMAYLCLHLLAFALVPCFAKNHVLFIVIDDLGFDDVGFRSHEIRTPTIDALAARGVVLDSYYVQDVCSPSRATFMTGRYAMHHTVVDWIPPASAYGLPLNETTMAEKFKQAGYATHMSGKWHLGFYKWAMTPTFRGFDSFLGFYSGGEDYFTHRSGLGYDFRHDPTPRCGQNCSQINWQDEGNYSTTVFTREAVRIVQDHDAHNTDKPLFLYLAYQGVHAPNDVPQSYVDPYKESIADPKRRIFAGMLSAVDEGITNVTDALQRKGMLNTTTIVVTSDNGGPVLGGDAVGARNWPLRGGKHSIWEGGVRAVAFVSGAGIADTNKGTQYTSLMHGADWLPTLSDVAGYDLLNTLPLDGVSQWSGISGSGSGSGSGNAPRTSVVLGNATNLCSWPSLDDPRRERYASMSSSSLECGFAIRDGDWKLIQGYGGGPDDWCNTTSTGRTCRNTTHGTGTGSGVLGVGAVAADGRQALKECPNGWCLYNIAKDPNEYLECSRQYPGVLNRLKLEMTQVLQTYHAYQIDPQCPTQTFQNDSHVGLTWQPWC